MARSLHFRRKSLPRGLEASLEAALGYQPTRYGNLLHSRAYAPYGLGIAPIPRPAVEAELIRRGHPPRAVRGFLAGYDHWASHDDRDDRTFYQRRYRHHTNQLLRQGDVDEIAPFTRTSGWLSW